MILTGMGGVGKTALAAQYASRYGGEYKVVWWANAGEPAALAASMARLATEAEGGEKGRSDQRELVKAAKRWLERTSRWLLVLDDVQDAEQIDLYLPTEHRGHVIIASRSRDWPRKGTVLNLLPFRREESVQLLLKAANRADEEGARRLAERVGDLPLALEMCAAFVKETNVSFTEYIRRFDAMELQEPTSVGAQIELAASSLERESPAAADILNLCAFLGDDEIPLELLVKVHSDREALRTLEHRSFAEIDDSGLRVHRLVAQIIRQRLTLNERGHWITKAVALLQSNLPPTDSAQSAATLPANIITHALSATDHALRERVALGSAARLLGQIGAYLRAKEDISTAKTVMEKALLIAHEEPELDKEETAILQHEMSAIFESLGDYTTAMMYSDRAVEVLRASASKDALGHALSNRGRLLYNLGRIVEALPAFKESLALARALRASEDEVANRLAYIGLTYRAIGDFQSALEAYDEALRLHRASGGPSLPSVADDLNGLGSLYRAMGDPERAKTYFKEALEIDRAALGPRHPAAVVRMNNLATVLRELGEYDQAASLLDEAIAVATATIGSDHPQLGVLLKNQPLLSEPR